MWFWIALLAFVVIVGLVRRSPGAGHADTHHIGPHHAWFLGDGGGAGSGFCDGGGGGDGGGC